jgi:hypothetical protein
MAFFEIYSESYANIHLLLKAREQVVKLRRVV